MPGPFFVRGCAMWRMIVAAVLLGATPVRAEMEHIRVGPLDRGYVLERFRAGEADGRLPIIIHLHGSARWCRTRLRRAGASRSRRSQGWGRCWWRIRRV